MSLLFLVSASPNSPHICIALHTDVAKEEAERLKIVAAFTYPLHTAMPHDITQSFSHIRTSPGRFVTAKDRTQLDQFLTHHFKSLKQDA